MSCQVTHAPRDGAVPPKSFILRARDTVLSFHDIPAVARTVVECGVIEAGTLTVSSRRTIRAMVVPAKPVARGGLWCRW